MTSGAPTAATVEAPDTNRRRVDAMSTVTETATAEQVTMTYAEQYHPAWVAEVLELAFSISA